MPKRFLKNKCLKNYTNHLKASLLTPGPHESKVKAIAPRTSLAAEVGSIKMDLVYDIKLE